MSSLVVLLSVAAPALFAHSAGHPAAQAPPCEVTVEMVIYGLYAFVLAVFLGFEVITKVPPTLHTPLMSGANAISGITLLGALASVIGAVITTSNFLAFLAVVLATVNVVGGFMVTDRMLKMFGPKKKAAQPRGTE